MSRHQSLFKGKIWQIFSCFRGFSSHDFDACLSARKFYGRCRKGTENKINFQRFLSRSEKVFFQALSEGQVIITMIIVISLRWKILGRFKMENTIKMSQPESQPLSAGSSRKEIYLKLHWTFFSFDHAGVGNWKKAKFIGKYSVRILEKPSEKLLVFWFRNYVRMYGKLRRIYSRNFCNKNVNFVIEKTKSSSKFWVLL